MPAAPALNQYGGQGRWARAQGRRKRSNSVPFRARQALPLIPCLSPPGCSPGRQQPPQRGRAGGMHTPHTRHGGKKQIRVSGAVAALSPPRAPRAGSYGRGRGLRCGVSSLPAPVISPHPVPRTAEGAAAAARDAVSMAMRDCIMLLTKLYRGKDAPGESPVPSAAPSPPSTAGLPGCSSGPHKEKQPLS